MRQNSVSFESSASTAHAQASGARPAVAFRRRLLGSGTHGGFRTAAGITAAAAAAGWAASFGIGAADASAATESPAVAETHLAATAERPLPAHATVLAQAVDAGRLDSQLVDGVGILSPDDEQAINDELKQLQQSDRIQFYIVYTDTFGGMSAQEYAESTAAANGGGQGSNVGVLAIAVDDRQYDVYASPGGTWSQNKLDAASEAAYDELINDNFAGAGLAAAQAVRTGSSGGVGSNSNSGSGNSGSGSSASGGSNSGDSSGAGWLAAGGLALAAGGGGVWYYNRRQSKRNSSKLLSDARGISPDDTSSLLRLPVATLEERADEEITSTDESIRRAKEELDLAIAEFGADRARQFTRAMNNSKSVMQRAFRGKKELDSHNALAEDQRRARLVEIISDCGKADRELDSQAEKFAEMRNLLAQADSKISELTQRSVAARSQLQRAQSTMASLQENYSPEVLHTIADNPEMAEVSLEEAEDLLAHANELQDKPAGQQQGLVETIRETEHALEVTTRLLDGVENARSNIATAKSSINDLIAEVEEEIAEAAQLKQQGTQDGTPADWDRLDAVVGSAHEALAHAKENKNTDPLGSYNQLLDADTELDDKLDRVREKSADHQRTLQLLQQQLQSANSRIQSAEDLISSRGRIVKSGARTALADAQRMHAEALQLRETDARLAIEAARGAGQAAQAAIKRAEDDVKDHQRSMNSHGGLGGPTRRGGYGYRRGRSSTGSLLTGMVLGSILGGSGGSSGFGGGFGGGGSFGGGGGFGGGHSGGSF
ncbi:TPM domain-containing protein [Corynebacterium sp. MSK297]|uniref:TPM domain-containing protein n=1 Tax=Corynebacterium sp. MSK297 TaxID=3050221 RepID=UPI00254D58FF|nr:TPM domain-containing protein [Corynebacterium sp. MSK297]MDK8846803.1 TPM domain-containing protein [Corynebacterium sp. MSK297]